MSKQQVETKTAAAPRQPDEKHSAPEQPPLRARVREMILRSPERRRLIEQLKSLHGKTVTARQTAETSRLASEAMIGAHELADLQVAVASIGPRQKLAENWASLDQRWREATARLTILAEQIDQTSSPAKRRPLEAELCELQTELSRFAPDYHAARVAAGALDGLRAELILTD